MEWISEPDNSEIEKIVLSIRCDLNIKITECNELGRAYSEIDNKCKDLERAISAMKRAYTELNELE